MSADTLSGHLVRTTDSTVRAQRSPHYGKNGMVDRRSDFFLFADIDLKELGAR